MLNYLVTTLVVIYTGTTISFHWRLKYNSQLWSLNPTIVIHLAHASCNCLTIIVSFTVWFILDLLLSFPFLKEHTVLNMTGKKCELKSKPNKTKPSKGKVLRTNPFPLVILIQWEIKNCMELCDCDFQILSLFYFYFPWFITFLRGYLTENPLSCL